METRHRGSGLDVEPVPVLFFNTDQEEHDAAGSFGGAYDSFDTIEKGDNGYYAFSPDLPGCQNKDSTFEETTINIREVSIPLDDRSDCV